MTPRVPELVVPPSDSAVACSELDSAFALWWMDFLAIAGVRDFTTPRLSERAFSP